MNTPPLPQLDPLIHAPARLIIVSILNAVEEADFRYLLHATGLTKGNLSTHLRKLEEGGYVEIEKTFRGRVPMTLVRLTEEGRRALARYRREMLDFLSSQQ
ncbi:MAG: transcriptional regulator [Anaerolineae bacterium]|nr:MAG: transcriptional regulator [Anaerolineae bacterium]